MKMQLRLEMVVLLHFGVLINLQCVYSVIDSSHLPVEARDDSDSQEEDFISTSYVLPNQIFNDGKPYYASKDPISGQLDFNAKKPAGIETAVNEVIDPKEKIVLSNSAPNIHDFLNLPVKYSSSKFLYPLVSSSYANLKYQGSNKNYITNKKPTSTAITPTPEYNHQNQYTIPTTKLTVVPSHATKVGSAPTTVSTTTTSASTTTATTTTSKKPSTTTKPTTTTTVTTPAPRPTSISIKTSIATSTSMLTPPKYTTMTRRPVPVISTTPPPKTTESTTRKKYIPTKKYSSTPSPTKSATPLRFPDQPSVNATTVPNAVQTSTTTHPTKQSSIFPTDAISTTSSKFNPPKSVQRPLTLQQQPSTQNYQPSSTAQVPNLNPADIYQTLGQKNTLKESQAEQKPTMTLADLFNTLTNEESAGTISHQVNEGLGTQDNLKQSYSPSKPSPFATQDTQQNQPAQSPSVPPQQQYQQNGQQPLQQLFNNEQNVVSGSQENFSNEYVSYQVQQPNVMQYRPAPGAINNVVISPGQNSASFVLGSQQQVGANAFGTVEKESLYGKDRPVQYGTVINEPPPQQNQQTASFQNTNNLGSPEEPPPAPSPYQQLPLIGGPNLRPQTSEKPQLTGSTDQSSNYPQAQQQETHTSMNPNQSVTKDILLQSNIRFPMNEEHAEHEISGSLNGIPPAGPHVNGHAQPLSLQQIQQSNNVVFPKTKDEDENSLQFQNVQSGNSGDLQIQEHEVITMNQHKQKLSFPQTPEPHTPSTHMVPPPPPPPPANSQHADFPQRQHSNRPHGPPPPFAYNEYTRKPIPGITRPNTDRHLPNILPQFRPNAKISNGHPGPNFNQEPGNIRIPPGPQIRRPGPNAGPPQFAHRRQPLFQQPRYSAHRASDYAAAPPEMNHPIEANRRVYRPNLYGAPTNPYADRHHVQHPMPYAAVHQSLPEPQALHGAPDLYKPLSGKTLDLPPERMAAFEEEDLVINDPPQPVTPRKDFISIDNPKLEPVVTLQMLQSQKKTLSLPNDDSGSGEIQVPSDSDNTEDNMEKPSLLDGLYVVYPMGGKNKDTSDATIEGMPAIAQVESVTRSEYQNTPFSVVRDQPQEPILTVKNKKAQSLQQQSKLQPPKDKFPYPIEKPDPSFAELNVENGVPGAVVAPRIVHGVFSTGTETPIAIAYTPTEPNLFKKQNQKYSNINLASSVIGEIRTDSQTEDGLNNDFDIRGQNLEKNFMAPFYPSASLGSATLSPANGWNILSSSTNSPTYEKNTINRADIADDNSSADNAANQNRNIETDNFQPELQGGFKPIYPPGYKIDDIDENENLQLHESNNRPLALASRMETTPRSDTTATSQVTSSMRTLSTTPKPQSSSTSSSTVDSKIVGESTTPIQKIEQSGETTTKSPNAATTPTQRKKTPFETSLEALLFGDDADFDSEARKQKSTTISKTRMAPRSGPRSMKLS